VIISVGKWDFVATLAVTLVTLYTEQIQTSHVRTIFVDLH